jgi:hypothetical protein
VKAEEVPHPELLNLFEADLVVDASFKSQDANRFYIIVNETIKGHGYGLKKGQQLNLPREDNGCGGEVDFSYYKRRRYYLISSPTGWRLNYGSTQSIQHVYSFGHVRVSDPSCGTDPAVPPRPECETMNRTIREFVKSYRWDPSIATFLPLVDGPALKALAEKNVLVAEFERVGRCCIGGPDDSLVAEEPEPEEVVEDALDLLYCDFLEQPAEVPFTPDELRQYVIITEYPLQEAGIEGKVYVQVTIDTAGAVSDVEVKRGLEASLDGMAVQKAYDMPRWKAAVDRYGRKRSCFTNLPFIFRLEN